MMRRDNPLAELEDVYLDGEWDRAFRRAGSSRGTLDLLRIALFIAADIRAIREAVEQNARPRMLSPASRPPASSSNTRGPTRGSGG